MNFRMKQDSFSVNPRMIDLQGHQEVYFGAAAVEFI